MRGGRRGTYHGQLVLVHGLDVSEDDLHVLE